MTRPRISLAVELPLPFWIVTPPYCIHVFVRDADTGMDMLFRPSSTFDGVTLDCTAHSIPFPVPCAALRYADLTSSVTCTTNACIIVG